MKKERKQENILILRGEEHIGFCWMALEQIKQNCSIVVYTTNRETGTKEFYSINLKKGIEVGFKEEKFGYENQLFIPFSSFKRKV